MSTGEMERPVVAGGDGGSGTEADALRAELLRRRLAGRGAAAPRRTEIPRADRTAALPLSYGQQQMWFLSRLEPDSPEYLVPLVLRLRGALDTEALERAWQGVVDRHEILRTRYELSGDEPVQIVDPPRPLPLAHTTAADDAEVRALVEADLARTFDLGRDWPVRGRLVRVSDDEHVLAVVFHHIACDAWSTQVFGQELSELYAGAAPAPLAVQYADYASWQRTTMTEEVVTRHLDHWKAALAGLPPLELPADRPRPPVRDGAGDAVPFEVPDHLAARLRQLAADRDSTLFMLFLAAYQTLLARHTGRTDIAVGTVVSGRGRPELQQLIGYGINSLVMRGDLSGDPSFTGLLARTRATVLDAYDHQDVAFAQVVEALAPERDLSRTPCSRSPSPCTATGVPPSTCPASGRSPSPARAGSPSSTSTSRSARAPTARSAADWSTRQPCSTVRRSSASPVTWYGCCTRSPTPPRPRCPPWRSWASRSGPCCSARPGNRPRRPGACTSCSRSRPPAPRTARP